MQHREMVTKFCDEIPMEENERNGCEEYSIRNLMETRMEGDTTSGNGCEEYSNETPIDSEEDGPDYL